MKNLASTYRDLGKWNEAGELEAEYKEWNQKGLSSKVQLTFKI